jgi:two-component sensor histidine kinase
MRTLPPSARIFLILTCIIGVAVAAYAALNPIVSSVSPIWELAVLALLALVSGGKKLRVIGRGKSADQDGSLSLGFIIILAAIIRGGPQAGCVVAVFSCGSSCLYPRPQPFHHLLFNLALTEIQAWLAGLTYVYLNRGSLDLVATYSLPAAILASVVFFSVNSAGVAGIIALCSGKNPVRLWVQTVIETAPPYIAGGLVIPLILIFSRGHVGVVLVFGAPIAFLIYHSYAANFALAAERQKRIDELQERETQLAALYATSESRARQQKSLTHLGVLALSDIDFDGWLREVADAVVRTLGVDASAIVVTTAGGSELVVRAGYGWLPGNVGERLPGGLDSLAGYTLLNRSPMMVADLQDESLFRAGPLLESHGIRSGATCIVYDAGAAWGILGAYSRERREFTPADMAYLQSVANVISLVLDRQRHVSLVEEHTKEIDALNARLQRAMAETHHRVKNNLQVVSALVDMQLLDGRPTIASSEVYRLGQHVRALATIHDLLTHEAKRDGTIQYLSTREMMDKLIPLVRGVVGTRPLRYTADDAMVPVQLGTSLAVLLNELVSNAVKHGEGEIDISLAVCGANGSLAVCDGGPGFPTNFDAVAYAHTGLELVESLSRWDLQGEPVYENRPEGGARVVVSFPLRRELAIVSSRDHAYS